MLKVEEVQNGAQIKEFLDFPSRLYQNDKNYIRPLDKDIEEVFNPEKNKFFKKGECKRFLFSKGDKTVGKVAVFVNETYKQEQPTGGIGFFDCINDQEIANFIFDYCKHWLQERGMEAMDGPINFGERDKFWGLLIEGFTEPLYCMNYNFPYYRELLENYGFQLYFNQVCFTRPIFAEVSKVFTQMHEKHKKNPKLSARRMTIDKIEKYAEDFATVYNAAWAAHGGGKQMEASKAVKLFKSMKPIINEHISWFIYEEEKPIAMWINIPDLNQWFKHLDGKFGLLEKLKFLFVKKFTKNEKMIGLVFGIIPEWQRTGIDGYMICEGVNHIKKHTHFKTTELQWIGDFNPKMIRIAENLETEVTRKLATYRYLFDRSKPFERHKML